MTVREYLVSTNKENCSIWQKPIVEIDSCLEDVCRYVGSTKVCLDSNQNFLNFSIVGVYEGNLLENTATIQCEANDKQKMWTIAAHRNKKYSY